MGHATITVKFGNANGGGDAVGHLSAEIDTRPTGLNGGNSSFDPGTNVAILIYKTDNVAITQTDCSAGSLSMGEQETVTIAEDVTFMDEQETSLPVPATSTPSIEWFGRSLGAITLKSDKMTLRAESKGVAVGRVTYQATASVLRLQSPDSINGSTDFSIAVLIAGTAS